MTKTFVPADGQPVGPARITKIVVDDERKLRYRTSEQGSDVLDDWPLLRWHMVTDEQWFARPDGWVEDGRVHNTVPVRMQETIE